jgi:serine phosphatase RsbU (regulator of sigma subunit)/anti-sigma regulatory factor (Ser/Thr protein kinase)
MSVKEDRRLRAVELTGLTAAPDAAFDALARAAATALRVPICLISLLDSDQQFFPGACGMPSPMAEGRTLPLTETLCRIVVESGRPLIFSDGPADPRVADNLMVAEFGVVAYMGFPLADDDGLVLGSLCVVDLEARDWTENDRNVLTALAEACCAELRLRTERTRAQAAADRAARLGALAAALAAALTPEDVTAVLAEQVASAVACDNLSVRLIQPEQNVAHAVHFDGDPPGYRDRYRDIRLDRPSAVTEVVTTRQAVFLHSAKEHVDRYGSHAGNATDGKVEGLARLPLLVEGELVGVLSVGYWSPQSFTAEERLFLTTIAGLAAQALGRAMRTERLRRLQSLSDLALSRLSLAELATDLGDRLARMFRASEVLLLVHDPQRLQLRPLGARGEPVPMRRGLIGAAVAQRRTVCLAYAPNAVLDPSDAILGGFGSFAIAPLILDGQLVGAMVIGRERAGPFAHADLDLLTEAATRVALAVDRGRAFERQRELARTLQSALLPPVLPTIPAMRLASTYQAAGAGIEVGGDFYDLFALGDGAWLAVIGDVRGRGPSAAVLTGLIRHTVRAVAVEEREPGAILSRVNAIVFDETGPEDFATVACVRLTPTAGRTEIVLASAGHCSPLILRADPSRDVEVLESTGLLLGAFDDAAVDQVHRTLEPGDVLLLHTDGLTESLGASDRFGEERLVDLLRTLSGNSPEEIVDVVHQAVLRHSSKGECEDDLALLALGASPVGHDEQVLLLEHSLSHGILAPTQARRLVGALDLPACLLADLRLVVSELVTNAAEHGQPGYDMTLRVYRQGARVRVEVRNAGAPFPVPQEFDPLAETGRGMHIVRSIAARMGVGSERGRVLVWCEFDPEPAAH